MSLSGSRAPTGPSHLSPGVGRGPYGEELVREETRGREGVEGVRGVSHPSRSTRRSRVSTLYPGPLRCTGRVPSVVSHHRSPRDSPQPFGPKVVFGEPGRLGCRRDTLSATTGCLRHGCSTGQRRVGRFKRSTLLTSVGVTCLLPEEGRPTPSPFPEELLSFFGGIEYAE